ncbi:MAG: hypothetical protein QOE77_2685 [Blastocatellia bacterium]|jgi:glycosyltransferase involved in cell wall biosynthesis|nr:hypothetical protein [Blastocatellia bacterium]
MAPDSTLRRIGVVDQSATGWFAATVYSRMILRSLAAACEGSGIELYFFSPPGSADQSGLATKTVTLSATEYLPGERPLRKLIGLPAKSSALRGEQRLRGLLHLANDSDVFAAAEKHRIGVLLPLLDIAPWQIAAKTIGWVPDFQHMRLPEFFPAGELRRRDETIKRLAERATLIMLSSHAARDDFAAFAPAQIAKARVVPFPSLMAFEPPAGEANVSREKFQLPEKFALVANQFWAHKNHAVVVRALAQLKGSGLDLPVVMTGLPADHRDPANKNFSALLQEIASAGLSKQILILGLVPHADLINLMRAAALIIQPSRFEGWSTVVQDAKALGRPVLCSDLPVHREQAPAALGFFAWDDPRKLSELLAANWPRLEPGPNRSLEATALAAERDFAREHGQALLEICREACGA